MQEASGLNGNGFGRGHVSSRGNAHVDGRGRRERSFLALPGEYLNVSGLENVSRWNLRLDGESKASVTAVVVDGELRLVRKGTVFLIR